MDIEQLKLIMDMLRTMGDAGLDAFVWWMIFDKALPVAGWLVTFGGIVWIARQVIRQVGINSLGEQVRDALGVGHGGFLTPSEARDTLRRVAELVAKKDAK